MSSVSSNPAATTTSVHDSPIGPLVSTWTRDGLHSLRSLPAGELETGWNPPTDSAARTLDELLRRYFATGRVVFESLPLDGSGWTAFGRAVYRECRRIPAGT